MGSGKTALILGGNGFIGHHMARRLKSEGYWVRVVDIKDYEYGPIDFCDENLIYDLTDPFNVQAVMRDASKFSYLPSPFEQRKVFDEVYSFACLMGGAGFVFTGEHDADIMHDSALINLNVTHFAAIYKVGKVFYSSSACMYPQELQEQDADLFHDGHINDFSLREQDAYPANPDSEYGWEKLFSERLYLAYARNKGLNVRIARFHNIYGPEGTYEGGREKAPAAICRKVIEASLLPTLYRHPIDKDTFKPLPAIPEPARIEIWGDGEQTRSFLYIDDCIDAVRLLMQSDFKEPINIGSEEMVTINQLAKLAISFSDKSIMVSHVDGPQGVRGRNSNNDLIRKELKWEPKFSLRDGLKLTYDFINDRLRTKGR